jgi:uncharacterized RDD family membrane protein YckC
MKMPIVLALLIASLSGVSAGAQDAHVDINFSNPAVRVLQRYTLAAGETANGVLVIANDATIAGHVEGDVLVVLGEAQLASTAVVDGSFVVVGGAGRVADGAQVHGDVFTLGGLDTAPGFSPGGSQVVVGTAPLGARLRGVVPWLTRGLLLGRPIVPDLRWVWTVAAVFFLLNLILNLLLDAPVRASAAALQATPLSAFATGLLVMLLAGPLCAILAISVVGIAVIPFLICALVLGSIIGRIAFARWLGMSIVHQADATNRAQSLRSFLIGSATMCVAYMIPVLGLVMWAMAAVFALGGATQAFARAYRRENPRRPRKTTTVAAVAATPSASMGAAMPPPDAPASLTVDAPQRSMLDEAPLPEPPAAPTDSIAAQGLLGFRHATFLERLAALCLDFVLVAMLAQVLRFDRLFWDYPAIENNVLLLALVYHVGFWTWKQTTVGGIICQLRLVRTDGGPVRFAEALVRGLSGIFSLVVAGLGFLWILRDPEKQAWHDRIAGTYVVRVPRDWPI